MKKKILIYKEKNVNIDIIEIVYFFNKKNKHFEFIVGEKQFELPDKIISEPETYKKIDPEILYECKNYYNCIFLTLKNFQNEELIEGYKNMKLISFTNWNHDTNLSLNNGLVYFLCMGFADKLSNNVHECEHDACIYNYKSATSEIDAGMRNAHIHPDCEKEKILPNLKNKNDKELYEELKIYLNDLSIASTRDMDILNFWKLIENEVNNCIINEISIQNFYSIKSKIELTDLKGRNFVFLLGENGSGKTIFLKALLIALKKYQIEVEASKEITGIISDILTDNKSFLFEIFEKDKQFEFNNNTNLYIKNIFAYGTNRRSVSSDNADIYGFMTLFKENEFLINPEQWLKDTKFAEFEAKEEKQSINITVDYIQNVLRDILEVENLIVIVSSQNVIFQIDNNNFSLAQLSEGYKNLITLVIDLIARLTENNPEIEELKEHKAVVLVDELDLFLHPTWEKNICNKLNTWFPNIQFFITTHSPILIDGAVKNNELSKKTVIYRFENKDNKTEITARYEGEDIQTWLPNILISSNLFDPNYIDEIPKDLIFKARTENSFSKMLKTDENIEKLRSKKEEIKKQYQELLKQNKND